MVDGAYGHALTRSVVMYVCNFSKNILVCL
jgi:hypothetical protein